MPNIFYWSLIHSSVLQPVPHSLSNSPTNADILGLPKTLSNIWYMISCIHIPLTPHSHHSYLDFFLHHVCFPHPYPQFPRLSLNQNFLILPWKYSHYNNGPISGPHWLLIFWCKDCTLLPPYPGLLEFLPHWNISEDVASLHRNHLSDVFYWFLESNGEILFCFFSFHERKI